MLKVSSLFTDGAVLCRRKEIRVFGEVKEGVTVTAVLRDANGYILAEGEDVGRQGRFLILLPPQEARTGCTLTVSAGGETAEARDVAIGEVFLAGGQSNMELELRNASGGRDALETHEDSLLRFFNVPRKAYVSPDQRKAMDETRWRAIAPGSGGENSAVAYFFARKLRERNPEIPVGIIGCYWGGTSITCWLEEETLRETAEGTRYLDRYAKACGRKSMKTYLQEEATFQQTLAEWNGKVEAYRSLHPDATWEKISDACGLCPWNPPAGPGSPYRPGGLAVSMVHEIVPVTLTAILYYQGEEDADKTERYDLLMIELIRRWRALFREATLPFLFVQLPMWLDFGASDTFRWPRLRLAQAAARDAMRNTGMVCLLDQGEYGNIHPVDKKPVGDRLAELAGRMLYGEGAVSPRAIAKSTQGNTMTVTLDAPVLTRDGKAPALLEVAEAEGEFVPADASLSGNTLRLWAKAVKHPVRARYAWTDYSDQVNLFGENGLPLEPFLLG